MLKLVIGLAILSLALPSLAATYSLSEKLVGQDFIDAFFFEAIPDPTHGRVNYVSASVAEEQGLAVASKHRFVIRADSETVLSPNGPGRNSVRLRSKKKYTTSVMVFNVRHMPEGCGTWPAIWTLGDNWPNQGEIDILEGVNDQGPNQYTLHTKRGCTMPPNRPQSGSSAGDNCDVFATGNAGCGVKDNRARSYGPEFNKNGGGWFAVEKSEAFIKVWFWSRNGDDVPWEVLRGAEEANPDSWGEPVAFFPSSNTCPFSSIFGPQAIMINLTFCGDWAGAVYRSSGCPSTCTDYVNKNPWAFKDAYFDFASLRIYE